MNKLVEVIVWSVFDIFLLGCAIILLIISSLRYFSLSRLKEDVRERKILNAFALLFVGLSTYLFLTYLSFVFLGMSYENFLFKGPLIELPPLYAWLTKIAMAFFFTSLLPFFIASEKIYNSRLHLASLLLIVIILTILIGPFEFVFFQFQPIIFSIAALYFIHSLFKLIKWSQRELRAATSFILIGNWFIGVFVGYMSPASMQLGNTPILIYPLSIIVGILVSIAPTFIDPNVFSRRIRYWYFFTFTILGFQILSLIYTLIISGFSEYLASPIILFIFFSIECFFLINYLKKEDPSENTTEIRWMQGIFTRPLTISEEEISVSKERNTCLTCKKELRRSMYLCPTCKVFYCLSCVDTLSNNENLCWVCNTPFDENKPYTLPSETNEKNGQDISFQEDINPHKTRQTRS